MTWWKPISIRIGHRIRFWSGKKNLLKRPDNIPAKTHFREDLRKVRQETILAKKRSMMSDLYSRWKLGEIQITDPDLKVLKSMEWGPIVLSQLEQVYKRYL